MTTTITARVDSEKKRTAEAILNDIAMPFSSDVGRLESMQNFD